MRVLTVTLIASVLIVAGLRADNWPQWRGPQGTGVSSETNLPAKWSTSENVAWRVRLGGLGVSSPAVWGDRVFVTSQRGTGIRREGSHPSLVQGEEAASAGERNLGAQGASGERAESGVTFVVAAYDRADGRLVWEHTTSSEGDLQPVHDKHNLATASAVTDGTMVYGWFGTGQLVALDMNGKLAWTKHLGAEYAPFVINWGHSSSPVLHKDSLILICYHEKASYLLALNKKDGRVKWKIDRGEAVQSYSTPLVIDTPSGPELIVNTSQGIEAHNADTGAPLWRTPEESRFPIPMPVYHDGTLYMTRGYRSGPYQAVRPGGRGDVTTTHVLWKTPTGAPYVSSLVYYDGLLYMASELGIVTCIDAKTGERVWRERVGGIFTASPAAGDGKIYLVSETGETVVLKAGRSFEIVSRNKLDDHLVASPAISQGQIFLRSDDHLIAIGKRTAS